MRGKLPPLDGKTVLSEEETYMGIMVFAPLILLGWWFTIFFGVGFLWRMAKAVRKFAAWFRHLHWSRDRSLSRTGRRWIIALAVLQILATLSVGFVSIALPLTVSQDAESTIVYYDFIGSSGPLRSLSAEPVGNSWVDCFRVEVPHENTGFLKSWWENTRDRLATYLGLG
jgi:hypothetical protein